jgi:hypothetical protein
MDKFTRTRAFLRVQTYHRAQERRDRLCSLTRELVLIVEHVFEGPKAELVDMPQLAFQRCVL